MRFAPSFLPKFPIAFHLPRTAPTTRPPIRAMSALWQADLGDTINLGKGHPNPTLLPLEAVRDAFATACGKPGAAVNILQYGRMQGNLQLCEHISNWIATGANGRPNTPRADDILITTGSGPALSIVTQLYTQPGDVILVDSPGYFLAFYAFDDCRLEVVNVRTDDQGIDVGCIEELIEGGLRPKMVYTVPMGNNPTGVGLSEQRKRRLVELAREYRFKIAADEVYMFLKFKSQVIPTSLFEYDDPNDPVVFSIGSFSKLLGPGMRVGWIASHPIHMKRLLDCGSLQSGGGFNPMASAAIVELFDNGFMQVQVERLRKHYSDACDVLCAAVDEYMQAALRPGEKLLYHRPEGGFFCFITLPDRFDCDKLLAIAKQQGVSYFAGRHSSPDKSGFSNSLRLCFAFVEAEQMKEGVRRIAQAMKLYTDNPSK